MKGAAWRSAGLGLVVALPWVVLAAGDTPRRSGFEDMSPALQALQRDPTQNPAMLAVAEGEALWSQPPPGAPAGTRACAGCHAGSALDGVAARYPRHDRRDDRPISLAGRVNRCRTEHQGAAAQTADGPQVLPLTVWLAWRSRGAPIVPDPDPRLEPWRQRGERLWQQRLGQLNLACVHCHDQRAGQRLGGALIPQGHPTGVPAYRLEWQAPGSLERRLRSCLVGVRAEPFAPGSDEWLALELYLMKRAAGMVVEGAAVRP